jgi:hypothetical protein
MLAIGAQPTAGLWLMSIDLAPVLGIMAALTAAGMVMIQKGTYRMHWVTAYLSIRRRNELMWVG